MMMEFCVREEVEEAEAAKKMTKKISRLVANDGLDQLGVGREQRRAHSLLEQSEWRLRRGVAAAGASAKGLGRLERRRLRQQRAGLGARGGGVGCHGHERQPFFGGEGGRDPYVAREEEGVSREKQEIGVDSVRLG